MGDFPQSSTIHLPSLNASRSFYKVREGKQSKFIGGGEVLFLLTKGPGRGRGLRKSNLLLLKFLSSALSFFKQKFVDLPHTPVDSHGLHQALSLSHPNPLLKQNSLSYKKKKLSFKKTESWVQP